MEKLLKRVVSIVCAIAMVVTCMAFTPAKVEAGSQLPYQTWTQVGAWELFSGHDGCSWAEMQYTKTGNNMGDVTMELVNSPNGVWESVEYSLGAKLKNYSLNAKDTDGDALVPDYRYDCVITYTSNKPGHIITNVEGVEYRDPDDEVTQNYYIEAGTDKQLTVATFEHNAFASSNDIQFSLGWLEKGTNLTISNVEFVKNFDEWTAVPNTDPDKTPVFEEVGPWTLNCMFSPKYTLYGKMKYKSTGDELGDTTFKVTSTSGFHNAWSVSATLKDYLETVECDGQEGLASGDKYYPTIKVVSNKKTSEDEHGKMQTIMAVISGATYEFPLTAEPGEENVFTVTDPEQAFKYNSGKPDVSFELDCVDKDTELSITEVSFTPVDAGWTKVPNEKTVNTGKWSLFARTGSTMEEGQWGALSYITNTPATSMADTQIKVRSSSGWHNAWATLATLPNFLEDKDLEVGRTYKPVITYSSTKATGIDDSGDKKTVLFSIDNKNLEFTLDATTEKTITLDQFTYENEKPEKPNDVTFNLDQVEPDTVLVIKDITFEVVNDGWNPIPNRKYTAIGNTGMELYARMGETVEEGSWGKTSYKFENGTTAETATMSDVLIKTRSTSGWYVTNNPASVIDFPNFAEGNMNRANRYTVSVTFESDRDPAYIKQAGALKNNIRLVVDGTVVDDFENLADGVETTITSKEFVYTGTSPDVRLILDEFTPNATIKVKSVVATKKAGDPDWKAIADKTATTVGPWVLYADTNADLEHWGEMFYATKTDTPTQLGDVTIYAYGTSGWFDARSMRAILSRYTEGKLNAGQNYSASITIDSSDDCYGLSAGGEEKGILVTIDNNDYVIPIYEGKFTYVIPQLSKAYSGTGGAADNVQFNFDTLTPTTVVNISDVSFSDPITSIPEISALTATAKANGQVDVTWEQTKDTVYGTVTNVGGFEVFVDGVSVGTALGYERALTTGILSEGKHTIKVVATLGSSKSTGLTQEVVIKKDTPTTEAPTQAPTQAPTAKPTAKPTQAPVKVPAKAAVKKVVKKKKSAKKIKVTLKKVAGATKYQVAVYKTKKNAKKNKKALVKKTTTKLSFTIKSKKLKGKKTVYVRARAWNTAGFGAWSGIKKSKKK